RLSRGDDGGGVGMRLVRVGDGGGWWLTRGFRAVVAVKGGGEDGGDVVMEYRICGGGGVRTGWWSGGVGGRR
ncbi:hypothetical protein Tco_0384402, partial [Tanacetum coccineum]